MLQLTRERASRSRQVFSSEKGDEGREREFLGKYGEARGNRRAESYSQPPQTRGTNRGNLPYRIWGRNHRGE